MPRQIPVDPIIRPQRGGGTQRSFRRFEIPRPLVTLAELPLHLVRPRVVGQYCLDLFHSRFVPSRGAVDTSQRESCLRHFGGDLARLFGVILGDLERRAIEVSQMDLPQRLAQAHVGENEARIEAQCLAKVVGRRVRPVGIIDRGREIRWPVT